MEYLFLGVYYVFNASLFIVSGQLLKKRVRAGLTLLWLDVFIMLLSIVISGNALADLVVVHDSNLFVNTIVLGIIPPWGILQVIFLGGILINLIMTPKWLKEAGMHSSFIEK